jgi:hypothetical protein
MRTKVTPRNFYNLLIFKGFFEARVFVNIDDGDWRAFLPLTNSPIKSPSGELLGE